MIRCPECGQRVLDVASSCPKCGHVLIQNPLETHDWGALRACGRCGKHIERDTAICPYCGHHVRAARMARRVAVVTVGVVLTAAAGVALWRSGVMATLREATGSARPEAAAPRPAAPAPIPALPEPDTVRAADIVAATPEPVTPDSATAPPPAPAGPAVRPPAAALPDAAPRPRDLVTRWTLEWANVRAARSVESTVVQVLPPGRALDVREMRQGWWAVYADGGVVGYIANSVLTTTPPG